MSGAKIIEALKEAIETVTPSCGCVFADLDIPCRREPAPCPICAERNRKPKP